MFRVVVPADFGDREVVWNVTAHGRTDSAYGSLRVDYVVDKLMKMMDIGGVGVAGGPSWPTRRPVVRVEGAPERTVRVGEPLALQAVRERRRHPAPDAVHALAAGQAQRLGACACPGTSTGATETQVSFEPEQVKVYPDYRGNSPLDARGGCRRCRRRTAGSLSPRRFHAPGTYVLRVMAHDGGSISNEQVTVDVTAP